MSISDKTHVKSLSRMYMIQSLKFHSSLSLLMSVVNHPVTQCHLQEDLNLLQVHTHMMFPHIFWWDVEKHISCTHHYLTETLNTWHTILWLMYVVCAAMRTWDCS